MNIDNRKVRLITEGNYTYKLVKLSQSQVDERTKNNIKLPCFMGYQGWALHSIL